MNTLKNELFNITNIDNNIANANFEELIHSFIEEIKISSESFETYARCLKQFIKYLNLMNIQKPTRQDIKNYILYLKENGKSIATINLYLVSVRRLFLYLEENGLYYDIARGIKTDSVKTGYQAKLPLNLEQNKRLILSVDDLRDSIIIQLMSLCGLRCIEIERSDRTDFEMIDGQAIMYVQGKGRTSKSEYIKIPEKTFKDLKKYFESRKDDSIASFVSTSNHSNGQRLTTRSISRIVKNHLKENGFDSARFTAHSLRHTFVSNAREIGISSHDVQIVGRWKQIETMERYNHFNERLNNNTELLVANAVFNS